MFGSEQIKLPRVNISIISTREMYRYFYNGTNETYMAEAMEYFMGMFGGRINEFIYEVINVVSTTLDVDAYHTDFTAVDPFEESIERLSENDIVSSIGYTGLLQSFNLGITPEDLTITDPLNQFLNEVSPLEREHFMDHICQVTEYLFSVLLRGHRIELGRTPVCTVLLMEGIVLMSLVDTPN